MANGYRLQMEAQSRGIEIRRKIFTDIREVFALYPEAAAVFNCTGLGSITLGGVEDKMLYPARVCLSHWLIREVLTAHIGSNFTR